MAKVNGSFHRFFNCGSLVVALAVLLVGGYLAWAIYQAKQPPAPPVSELRQEAFQPAPTDVYLIRAIEGNTEIRLPASAREIYSVSDGFREIDACVRFRLPVGDLAGFLQSAHCQDLQPTTASNYACGSQDPVLKTPNPVTNLKGCTWAGEHFTQRVYVDASEPQSLIVYVFGSTH